MTFIAPSTHRSERLFYRLLKKIGFQVFKKNRGEDLRPREKDFLKNGPKKKKQF